MNDELFSYIDLAFAKHFTQNHSDPTLTHFLALLMKRSREGSLSLYAPNMREKMIPIINERNSPIVADQDHYYLRRNFALNDQALQQIARLSQAKPKWTLSIEPPKSLNTEQKEAFITALQKPLLLLFGGPGSGKTHFAKTLITSLLEKKPDLTILATAPTGKAASRIKQKGVKTGTLHSLLGIKQASDLLKEPKPLIADLILIDECSMIDLTLWAHLLKAIPSGTHVILIGDPYQLHPIDGSSLFTPLCQAKTIPHVHLTQIVRTDKQDLLTLARLIREDKREEAIHLIQTSTRGEIELHPLPKLPPIPKDPSTAILTPFTKGPLGTATCNAYIDNEWQADKKPIMIVKNDYTLQLMNGDRGYLQDGKAHFTIDDEEKIFPPSLLPPYELSYATTIHKSQGSEFDSVILLLPELDSEPLSRELIYTGITRAKKHLTIYGNLS